MASSVPSDLGKLTVPQLKALCKERRITGYSKLGKAALLQRLADVVAPTKTTTPANDQPNPSAAPAIIPTHEAPNPAAHTEPSTAARRAEVAAPTKTTTPTNGQANPRTTAAPAITPTREASKPPAYIESSSTTRREENVTKVAHQPGQTVTVDNTQSTETSTAKAPLPIELHGSSQKRIVSSTTCTSTQKASATKRPAHIDISSTPKRSRTSLKPTPTTGHEHPVPRTTTFQQKLPADSSVFKVPEVPAQHRLGRSLHVSASTPAKQLSGNSKSSAVPRQVTGGPGRFKPLVVSRTKPVEPDQANKEASRSPVISVIPKDSALFPNFHTKPFPALTDISFPPKASQRKWVYRWAIILSALSPTDRQICMLVSRTFRYAVYLSAIHILSRNYDGRRLDAVLEQHTRNMTNFWPYLRLRVDEVSERRRAFKWSFLGRYTDSLGYHPLTSHLWTNPDDEKQVDVAIRFVLTRMWFAVSVGAYGHDASTWSRCVIQDVREVVKGEVWQVIARDDDTGESCTFYVLEATCEVIGRPPSSQGENTLGYHLRADWTAWISQQSRAVSDARQSSLLDCVKWSNTEDYHLGISKAWLRRVQGRDADSIVKRSVAERYILASVVENGISGQWMSTSAMAQEFAGLPGKVDLGSRPAGRSVNMYLPAHHHIESVHFTTSKGETLHDAVAVVQTPGREYYVLRDNGMQVGCEEEGVPEVWQRILGCDTLGRARYE